MTTPQTPAPAAPPAGGPLTTITTVGTSLIRLGATVITLPLNTVSTVTANLAQLVNNAATSAGNAVANPTSNEVVKAASELVNATAGLYLGVIKSAVGGLEQASRAVSKAVADATGASK